MTALKGPLTPPLQRQGPQGLVKRPTDRGPHDQSVKSDGLKGHPAKTPRPKGGGSHGANIKTAGIKGTRSATPRPGK